MEIILYINIYMFVLTLFYSIIIIVNIQNSVNCTFLRCVNKTLTRSSSLWVCTLVYSDRVSLFFFCCFVVLCLPAVWCWAGCVQ